MSERYVKILRQLYERWGQGDFRASEKLFDPEVTLVMRPEFPDPGSYHGLEEIRHYTRDHFLADLDDAAISAEEFLDAGESVVVRIRQSATGAGSGAPVEMSYYQVWTFRGERVVRIENVREREDALEAAELQRGWRTSEGSGR